MSLFTQRLEYPARHFARATHDTSDFLAGDPDLHAVRVGHCIRFLAEFEQGMCDASGNIEKCKVADFTAGLAQAGCQLCC